MFKEKTMKISEYIQIAKQEYVTVQLVPVKSNKNNNTDAIATMINKMYLQLNNMVNVQNKKLIIQTKAKASYYIHITKEEVQFYFIIPKVHMHKFKTKFSETWKNIEIKEVETIPISINDCTKYQLNYKYNDALSLNVDKRSNDLLNANMSILEILEAKESVGVFYNFIPTSDKESNYFKTLYDKFVKQYKNGENLKKHKHIGDLFVMAVKFILGLVDDFLGTMQTNLSNNEVNNRKVVGIRRKVSSSTERKYHKDLCKTQIIVATKAEDKHREKILANSMCNSFKSVSDDNELVAKKVKKGININALEIPNVKINNTTVEECNNFIALPGSELITQYKNIEHKQTKENPVPEELKSGICYLGPVVYKNSDDNVFLNNSEQLKCLPHVLMGGSRSGKTTISINICKNLIDEGEGLIVPDFIRNCEFADTIARITPPERLIDIDLSKFECIQALAINKLKITKNMSLGQISKITRRKTTNFLELINIMNNDDKQLAPKMRKYLGAAARIAFCFNNSSGKDVMRILQVHTVRHEFINKLSEDLKVLLEDSIISLNELDEYSKVTKESPVATICGTKENKIEGIIDRIDLFRENDVIDAMFSKTPENNIDFVEAMEQKKVILIRMRDCDFEDETSKDVLMTFFMQKIWLATKLRAAKEEKEINKIPPRVTLLIDEIFQVPTCQKILEKTFLQSAKFGLKYMFTLHNLEGLSKEALASLKGANTTYTLISGVDKKAFEALEEEFTVHGYCLDDMLNLEQYTALHLIKNKNGYDALITKLPPELKVDVTEYKQQNIA